ncbi:MAG: 50S ribosomal protein L20 [Planctomycetota bacterium]
MSRANTGVARHRRKTRLMKAVKGYQGGRRRLLRTALEARNRAAQYAYRDRKKRKIEFRKLWIQRINAAARANGMTYSRFINGLSKANVTLNRKQLSELAIADPAAFSQLVEMAQGALV